MSDTRFRSSWRTTATAEPSRDHTTVPGCCLGVAMTTRLPPPRSSTTNRLTKSVGDPPLTQRFRTGQSRRESSDRGHAYNESNKVADTTDAHGDRTLRALGVTLNRSRKKGSGTTSRPPWQIDVS